MPNAPTLRRGRVLDTLPAMRAALDSVDSAALLDHQDCPWLRHLAVEYQDTFCYVVFRMGTLRQFRCAEIVHVTSPRALAFVLPRLRHHLLVCARIPFLRVERRLLPNPPRLSRSVDSYYAKQFRSDSLTECDISNLYSELVALPM